MLKNLGVSLNEPEKLFRVAKALDSMERIEILRLLNHESFNINELAEMLDLPTSTAANHINILEAGELIFTNRQPGIRGHMKLCSRSCDSVFIGLHESSDIQKSGNSVNFSMPIGSFFDCCITPTCGIANENGPIDNDNDPTVFYNPKRITAQIIWLADGFLEYRFPRTVTNFGVPTALELSFEACSEAPYFREDWKSDISVWINGTEIATWTCPGDFGDRRGILNPSWWSSGLTQYGRLKRFTVTDAGSFLDSVKCSSVNLEELKIADFPYINVKIGLNPDTKNKGGLNLFGEKFGDHPQNINMRIDYNT